MSKDNLETLDDLKEETTEQPHPERVEEGQVFTITNQAVIASLQLDGPEVTLVRYISEVEAEVAQGDRTFVVGRELLGGQ